MNLAPNGKPSNLTPEQYKLVRTPAFKKWFGDWENSPETASKVVDENGEPLVVYHGTTNKNINIFRPLSYFTENYSYAKVYGLGLQYSDEMDDEEYDEIINRSEENVYSVFLNIVNPLKADRVFFADNFEGSTKVEIAKIDGYDGMINTIPTTYSPFYKENENQFLIFNSNQIKLADGTNTTFDANNPDIRYERGGSLMNYLRNIRLDDYYHKGHPGDYPEIQQYRAEFGRKGGITFRVYPNEDGVVNSSIYVASIDRGTLNFGEIRTFEGKKDSRGEGAMAIASLFLKYPLVKSLHYEDESYYESEVVGFWQKIGGDSNELFRGAFFSYFENKFGYNPDIRYAEGGSINEFIYEIGGL